MVTGDRDSSSNSSLQSSPHSIRDRCAALYRFILITGVCEWLQILERFFGFETIVIFLL